jgi:hypothetical protein
MHFTDFDLSAVWFQKDTRKLNLSIESEKERTKQYHVGEVELCDIKNPKEEVVLLHVTCMILLRYCICKRCPGITVQSNVLERALFHRIVNLHLLAYL